MVSEEEQRFLRLVEKEECWIWKGTRSKKGYGRFRYDAHCGKGYAHRFSHEHFIGPIDEGNMVLHSCHVPCCVNPAHLRQGTAQENTQDMIDAGRQFKRGCVVLPKQFVGHVGIGHSHSFERMQEWNASHDTEIHVRASQFIWKRTTFGQELRVRGLL